MDTQSIPNVLLTITTLASLYVLYLVLVKEKRIPWSKTPMRLIRTLLHDKPKMIFTWKDVTDIEIMPHDRKLLVSLEEGVKITSNTIICVGKSEDLYDKYLVIGRIKCFKHRDLYLLDVDYLGTGSSKQGTTVTFTL